MKLRVWILSYVALLAGCSSSLLAGVAPKAENGISTETVAPRVYVVVNDRKTHFHGGSIDAYSLTTRDLTQKITRDIKWPGRVTFDNSGNLFVLNNTLSVDEYAPGATIPFRVIRSGLSQVLDMAVDEFDDLYVANGSPAPGNIAEYAPGSVVPARTITNGIVTAPIAIAVDGKGFLYVGQDANGSASRVTVYDRGGGLVRTVRRGVVSPIDLAFDAADNLYVANFSDTIAAGNDVAVYKRASSSLMRTIRDGIKAPFRLAFDANYLYVVNQGDDSITVYSQSSAKPVRAITNGLSQPQDLRFDDLGNLYVGNVSSNDSRGWISIYSRGSEKPQFRIDVSGGTPGDMVIGPHE